MPFEIAQYQASRNRLSDFSTSVDGPASQESIPESEGKQEEDDDDDNNDADDDEGLERDHLPSQSRVETFQSETRASHSFDSDVGANVIAPSASSFQIIPSSQESIGGRMGYLANRRSTAPRPSQDEAEFDSIPPSQETVADVQPQRRPLRKSSSVVRLSMTSNGVAKIVTEGDSSPSPPRKRSFEPLSSSAPAIHHGDQSASVQNAAALEGTPQPSSQATSSLRKKPSGRSRDSRAWEFWCDRDARSELEEKADQEASGSAADAIGLIRSNSGRNILGQLIGKRDSPFRESTSAKRTKTGRAPLLQRAQSFQNRPVARNSLGGKSSNTPRALKKAVSGLGIRMPTTDSDKENWSPERIIPASEKSIRTVETDHDHSGRRSSRIGVFSSTQLPPHNPREVEEVEDDEEVSGFMARGRQSKSNSVSEEEELDCVQGLLSLSQGAWR